MFTGTVVVIKEVLSTYICYVHAVPDPFVPSPTCPVLLCIGVPHTKMPMH